MQKFFVVYSVIEVSVVLVTVSVVMVTWEFYNLHARVEPPIKQSIKRAPPLISNLLFYSSIFSEVSSRAPH